MDQAYAVRHFLASDITQLSKHDFMTLRHSMSLSFTSNIVSNTIMVFMILMTVHVYEMADHNLFNTFFLSPFFRFSNNLSPACLLATGPSVNVSFDTSSLEIFGGFAWISVNIFALIE